MDSRRVKTEISILKFYQLFHILLIFLIVLCHIISVHKYQIILNILLIFFCISLFIYILNFIFLSISTSLLFTKKKSPSLFNLLKKITLIAAFISLIKGIILTSTFWINYYYYFNKYKEYCPFGFSLNKIEKLINNTKQENFSKICSMKKCTFNSSLKDNNDQNVYNYLCNFNPVYDLTYNKDNNIECKFVIKNNYIDTKYYYYLEKCDSYTYYYSCSTKEKRHGKYYVKYNQKCNKNLKKKKYIALGFLFPFIDVLADVTIWLFIYSQYKLIIKYINYVNFAFVVRYSSSSLNSTKDTSIIRPNNNNRDVITLVNINQTRTIFYPPLDSKKDEKNKNRNKNNDKSNNNDNNKIKDINKDIEKKIDIDTYKNNSSFDSNSDIITSKINLDTSI